MKIMDTRRLWLREYREDDLDALYAILSDEEMMTYYPAPFSLEKTKDWIKRNQQSYRENGYGLWAVCLKGQDTLIGDCGLVKQMIDDVEMVEVGYHIHRQHWSQGYASEVALACKQYGFEQLGLSKLISIIDPRNQASIRVAEKIGFTLEKEAFIFGKDHLIYSSKFT